MWRLTATLGDLPVPEQEAVSCGQRRRELRGTGWGGGLAIGGGNQSALEPRIQPRAARTRAAAGALGGAGGKPLRAAPGPPALLRAGRGRASVPAPEDWALGAGGPGLASVV